jgi:hypothetical protein
MNDVPVSDLHRTLGKREPYVSCSGSFNQGVQNAIEVLPIDEILSRRIEAIQSAIEEVDKRAEKAEREQAAARYRQGEAIRLRGRLHSLLHRTREQRKAVDLFDVDGDSNE